MSKVISTFLILFLATFCYSQNITLLKNYNPKVKELKHNLNLSKDSLSLRCEGKIIKVDIFNDDYDQSYDVKDNQGLIPLRNLPEGKFVVEVHLTNKIVEMHVVKYFDNKTDSSIDKKNIVEGSGMMLDEKLNLITSPPKNSIEFILTGAKRSNLNRKKQKFYWVVHEVNTGNNSHKSMKLLAESVTLKMISKNKLETKTNFGKLNKLTVWEVYNTTQFMQKQVANPEYINSSASDLFNVEPYYSSSKSETSATI
ncbi:hypothetical protein [Winogradskyella flava]|uniref:Uncharacterized protein n=1 Tax=Winogradskyella flava TaxID=1884876 RepID=A0A842ITR8_9FLAO|nr:hypothetical protein [Winogradskyella flava]MBC2846440.1 hypothetical protein [Winogradskyella flava]